MKILVGLSVLSILGLCHSNGFCQTSGGGGGTGGTVGGWGVTYDLTNLTIGPNPVMYPWGGYAHVIGINTAEAGGKIIAKCQFFNQTPPPKLSVIKEYCHQVIFLPGAFQVDRTEETVTVPYNGLVTFETDHQSKGISPPIGTYARATKQFRVLPRGTSLVRALARSTWTDFVRVEHSDTIYSQNILTGSVPNYNLNRVPFAVGIWGTWIGNGTSNFTPDNLMSPESVDAPPSGMTLIQTININGTVSREWSGTPKSIKNQTVKYSYTDQYGSADTEHILDIHEQYENVEHTYNLDEAIVDGPDIWRFGPTGNPAQSVSFTTHQGGDWSLSIGFPLKWLGFDLGATQAASELTTTIDVPVLNADQKAVLKTKRATNRRTYYFDEYDILGKIAPIYPLLKRTHTASSLAGEQPHWVTMPKNQDPGGGGGFPG
jgi:hypothetical protein